MSLGDVVLGPRAPRHAWAALVHGITTARLTLEVDLGLRMRAAALAFESLDTAADYNDLVAAIVEHTGARATQAADGFGYCWLTLRGDDIEELAIAISIVAESFERGGGWEQLVCAVFAFERRAGVSVYLVYNLARGAFYAFVPRGESRDLAEEGRIQKVLSRELRVEPDAQHWHPLWDMPV